MIVVYSKPSCVQCSATYRALDRAGLPYKVVDLTADKAAYRTVKDLGYAAAPVVVTETGHWAGFQPDKISALAASAA